MLIIQPRVTCSVEWSTEPRGGAFNQHTPSVSPGVAAMIRERAEPLQATCKSRHKGITSDGTTGTIQGLHERQARELATWLASILNDPKTYRRGKVVQLFTSEPEGPA